MNIIFDKTGYDNIAIVMQVKDEEDVIFYNLEWHYKLGIRKFFIMDNQSSDNTVININLFKEKYKESIVYILIDPIVQHYHGLKMTAGINFIKTMWNLKWILLVDADEFLCPIGRTLNEILSDKKSEVLKVYKTFYNLLESYDVSKPFYDNIQYRTAITNLSSKIIISTERDLNILQGSHDVLNNDKTSEVVNDLVYAEFRIRSFKQYKRKIINGAKAAILAIENGYDAGCNHWIAPYNEYLKYGDDRLLEMYSGYIESNIESNEFNDTLNYDGNSSDYTGLNIHRLDSLKKYFENE